MRRLHGQAGFLAGQTESRAGDINFYVPSPSYGYVEMTHAILGHCITDFAAAHVKAQG